jgi:type III secretion protein D
MSELFSLYVDRGPNEGAESTLEQGVTYLLGTNSACDLVFSDSDMADQHATCTIVGQQVAWKAMQGEILAQDKCCMVGDSICWPVEKEITLGGTHLRIARSKTNTRTPKAAATQLPDALKAGRPTARSAAAKVQVAAAAVLILFGGFAIAWSGYRAVVGRDAVALTIDSGPSIQQRLQAVLEDRNLKQVSISLDSGFPTLSGVVDSRDALTQLKTRLRLDGINARFSVVTGQEIAERVQDVFRMHGFAITSSYEGNGRVIIEGVKQADKKFEAAVKAAMDNVSGLAGISVGAAEPAQLSLVAGVKRSVDPAPSSAPVVSNDPKRVTSIVSGATPFVLTADGARYFEGALLPLGQRLIEIQENAIMVEQGGKVQQIKF